MSSGGHNRKNFKHTEKSKKKISDGSVGKVPWNKNTKGIMKNNLKVSNLVMSGRLSLKKERISVKFFDKLILKYNWIDMSLGENYGTRFSKKFLIREKEERNVHGQIKGPHVTIFALGGIIIVGLKNKKEADIVYDLVIKDLNKVSKNILK